MHRQHHQFIDVSGLLAQQDVNGQAEVEVTSTLAQGYWHQGLATEAPQACRDDGWQVRGLRRLISLIVPENIPSRRVAQRIGMRDHEKDIVDIRATSCVCTPFIMLDTAHLTGSRLWRSSLF